jgi:hypothetical protein
MMGFYLLFGAVIFFIILQFVISSGIDSSKELETIKNQLKKV